MISRSSCITAVDDHFIEGGLFVVCFTLTALLYSIRCRDGCAYIYLLIQLNTIKVKTKVASDNIIRAEYNDDFIGID